VETTKWLVKGMNCVGCASTVNKYLESIGMENIHVDFTTDEVQFLNKAGVDEDEIARGIEKLGYHVSFPDELKKKDWTLSF